jgi:hypothetical protein
MRQAGVLVLRDQTQIEASQMPALMQEFETGWLQDPLSEPLSECVQIVRAGFLENFQLTEDSSGRKWPPHSPVTVRMYGPHPPLILSDAMRSAVAGEAGPGAVFRDSFRSFETGTDLIYARTHQEGDPTRNIPQREFLYASENVQDECQVEIEDFIFEHIL